MIIEQTPLQDCYVLKPRVFQDDRGYFFESYSQSVLKDTPIESYHWIQDNESKSEKGVLRGLHFQKGSQSQAKLVRVVEGEVFDVAVDLRKNSPTFGKHHSLILSGENKNQFLVPKGFAHGFLVLSETAIFTYKCDNFYSPEHESGVLFDDEQLGITWPKLNSPYLLSEKDQVLPSFENCYKF